MTWWFDRHPRGDGPDGDAPPDHGRSVYEDRIVPQDADPADRAVWVRLGEYGSDGLPLPGTMPAADWKETLARSGEGWQPIDQFGTSGRWRAY